ncbi:MAG: hypothetical protein K2K85_08040 [Clostridia bacterium]|nr:hypothetical protein [Clostridia bacterium]
MNILISATTATQLTVCLIFLLLILALEAFAFVALFMWRKKALQPKKQSAENTQTQSTASSDQETQVGSVQAEQTVEPQAAESQTELEGAVAEDQTANSVNEQPAEEQTNTTAEQPAQDAQEDKKQGQQSAFAFVAPFALLSAASGVSSLRGAVYAFAIICMIAAVGAVALAVVFAMQISKKKDEPVAEPAQEPADQPVLEPEPVAETQAEEPQPVEEVVEEPAPEPVVEEVVEPEPQPEPEPVVEVVEQVVEEPVEVVATTDEDDDDDDEDDEKEEEEENRIFVETDDGGYFIILERTFTARIIQAKKQVKEYYSHIKNAFLSFKKVSARMSKPRESFRYGRATIARLAIRGKTLRLYLDLDPLNYADGRYKVDDVSDIATYADTPLLIKITNERRCEYAIELIEDLMIKIDAIADDKFEEVDYVEKMPFESTDALVDKGLIVKKLAKGTSLFDSKVVDVLTPTDDESDTHVSVDSDPISDEDSDIADTYERSFTAKLMQSDITVKQFYSQLKNHLLSYGKVNARMTKKREVFRFGKVVVAKMSLRSKTLRLYLALDYGKYKDGKFMVEDASSVKAVEDTPVLYRIANERRSRFAKELIDEMLKALGAEQSERSNIDYTVELPYKTDEELFHQGLIVLRHVAGVTDKK